VKHVANDLDPAGGVVEVEKVRAVAMQGVVDDERFRSLGLGDDRGVLIAAVVDEVVANDVAPPRVVQSRPMYIAPASSVSVST
jgi:hypothetical protein